MTALLVFQWIAALVPGVLLLWFSIEIVVGLPALAPSCADNELVSHVILVPAHDEAKDIVATLAALRKTAPAARIVVIADNCSDSTAQLARDCGVEVVERNDPLKRGKGYALAFGRDYLCDAPPCAVIVLDADCRISNGGASALAMRACRESAPVQSCNLLVADLAAPPNVAISNFAMIVKNLFRARGMHRIGGGSLLFGTGMAFPWGLFARLRLATGEVTEDLSLALTLARAGERVILADDVRVTSPAASEADSVGQRRRWEHGFLANALRHALPLIGRSITHRSRTMFAIGAHMLIPPLALLAALGFASLAILCATAILTGYWVPTLALASCFAIALLAVLTAWVVGGRGALPARSLMAIPGYIIWKLPIYGAFLKRRQQVWNRTKR